MLGPSWSLGDLAEPEVAQGWDQLSSKASMGPCPSLQGGWAWGRQGVFRHTLSSVGLEVLASVGGWLHIALERKGFER